MAASHPVAYSCDVAGPDFATQIKQLQATMHTIEQVLDVDDMRKEIVELGEQVAAPDLWDDQANAQKITGRLSTLQGELERFTSLQSRIDDLSTLLELAQEEDDADSLKEVEAELQRIHKAVELLEVRTLLSGEYDAREALVTIRSGAGGVDAADFAEMLHADVHPLGRAQQVPRRGLRHLLRRGGGPEVRDLRDPRPLRLRHPLGRGRHPPPRADQPVRQPGPPPDVVRGRRGRAGARADRRDRDPGRGDPRRRLPLVRSGRPVGQHDRLGGPPHAHPDGHRGRCQNEKSQLQNKASAMVILKAKLLALKKAEERAHLDSLRGDVQGSWGDQMRNYVLHPYQLVKDLRTEYEAGNPKAVFDGDIDAFLEAGIRWRSGADKAPQN